MIEDLRIAEIGVVEVDDRIARIMREGATTIVAVPCPLIVRVVIPSWMRPAATPAPANPSHAANPAFAIGMTKLVRLMARQAAAEHYARCASASQATNDPDKRVIRLDDRGERVRGLLEVDKAQAAIVERIFTEFAAGASSIQIATRLNADGVPGPRGGQWNASTVRGDPKKATGILNNPLYVGRLVWGRRQWRRNPDSEKRERRYRLREHSEWIEVAVPDLRIVDDAQWSAVQTQIEQRSRPSNDVPIARQNRRKHLLSGLIRCSCCGSGYTISGKDYYRCAGQKERGTCSNTVSVRKGPLETATLSILQHQLLTEDHARLFAEEFQRELARLTSTSARQDQSIIDHLAVVTREIDTLAANMLAAVASPALLKLLGDREAEKARLEGQLNTPTAVAPSATILSRPAVQQLFKEKVGRLREALDAETVRDEAAEILSTLIESVTIYPDGRDGPEAEVVAKVADLVAFATNDNAAREGGIPSSMVVVAGTGFEPVTFRL